MMGTENLISFKREKERNALRKSFNEELFRKKRIVNCLLED